MEFLTTGSSFVLGALAAATASLCSCERANSVQVREQLEPSASSDSIQSIIGISASYPIKNLDLFIYADSWTRLLEQVHNADILIINHIVSTKPGDKRLIIIANSPHEFNIEALRAFDSIELLEMNYADEDPEYPLMSAFEVFSAGDSIQVTLSPLLCPVEVLDIQNNLENTPLLQNPRIRLTNVNSKAEILRFNGFHPSETVDSPDELAHPQMMSRRLSSDIGLYASHPGIKLYCYPIDSPEDDIAAVHTTLIFEAEVDSPSGQRETISREWPLPTIPRNTPTALSLSIE